MEYLEIYYLISKCLEIFLLYLCDWLLHDSTVVKEHILHDFNSDKFVKVCFMAHDTVSLGEQCLKKIPIPHRWVKCFINVN